MGINNQAKSGYFDLNRNMEFDGAWDVTPFKGTERILEGPGRRVRLLGGLAELPPSAVEHQLDPEWRGEYQRQLHHVLGRSRSSSTTPGMRAIGERIRATPHLYWYGRLSFLGEYMLHSAS